MYVTASFNVFLYTYDEDTKASQNMVSWLVEVKVMKLCISALQPVICSTKSMVFLGVENDIGCCRVMAV